MPSTIEIYKEKLNNNHEIRIILFYKKPQTKKKIPLFSLIQISISNIQN